MSKARPAGSRKSEARLPAGHGKISKGDRFVLIRPDGSILTSHTGSFLAGPETLARVQAGENVQTVDGLLTYRE